jgi:hypothetical protein
LLGPASSNFPRYILTRIDLIAVGTGCCGSMEFFSDSNSIDAYVYSGGTGKIIPAVINYRYG